MGSNKNKVIKRHGAHRHIYMKKTNPFNRALQRRRTTTPEPEPPAELELHSSRIINLEQLQRYVTEISQHSIHCSGAVTVCGEYREGLASVLYTRCLEMPTLHSPGNFAESERSSRLSSVRKTVSVQWLIA